MDTSTVRVAEYLYFDVAGPLKKAFDIDPVVAEHGPCRGARPRVGPGQFRGRPYNGHTATTTAGNGLDDDGITDGVGDIADVGCAAGGLRAAGEQGQASLAHQRPRHAFVSERRHHSRRGTDENQTVLRADLGEIRILGQKSVTGMDGIGLRHLSRFYDGGDIAVAAPWRRRPDTHGLVGVSPDDGIGVRGRIDGDCPDAELTACPGDPQRDLASVRDENFLKQFYIPPREKGRGPLGAAGRGGCAIVPYPAVRQWCGVISTRTWLNSTASPFSTQIRATVPPVSAVTGFSSFIASMMPMVAPASMTFPTAT